MWREQELAAMTPQNESAGRGAQDGGEAPRDATRAPYRTRDRRRDRHPLRLAQTERVRARTVAAKQLEHEAHGGVAKRVDQRSTAGLSGPGERHEHQRAARGRLDELHRPQRTTAPARPEPDRDMRRAVRDAAPERSMAASDRVTAESPEHQED